MGVKNFGARKGPEGSRRNVQGVQLCRYVKSLMPCPRKLTANLAFGGKEVGCVTFTFLDFYNHFDQPILWLY